ncbi:MAG: hypothetical protein AAF393_06270 [Pseudomonadota bacterium]
MKPKALFFAAVLAAAPTFATPDQVEWPECFCTDKSGSRVELGELRCMLVDGRNFTARCEMSLNNPMWREIDEGCLSSQNDGTTEINSTS